MWFERWMLDYDKVLNVRERHFLFVFSFSLEGMRVELRAERKWIALICCILLLLEQLHRRFGSVIAGGSNPHAEGLFTPPQKNPVSSLCVLAFSLQGGCNFLKMAACKQGKC